MNKEFSIYLDSCRFFAAVVVVLSHLTNYGITTGDWTNFLPDSGRDAVIVFFVLSGLVIYFTATKKNSSLTDFISTRASRIYSVALPIIILTVTADLIGLQFNPESYTGLYQYEKLYIYIPFHLAFFGEIWTLSEQPFTVPPYWSLGYEVWYYALFAVLFYYRGTKRLFIFSILFVMIGYKLWLLFPIWLSGILLMKLIITKPLKQHYAWILFTTPIVFYFYFKFNNFDDFLFEKGEFLWPFHNLPLGSASKYLSDYLVCILFFAHLYGARFVNLNKILKHRRLITSLSSYTFTLYLVHAPVMKTIHHNMNINTESIWTSVFVLIFVIFITWLLGQITEKRKSMFFPITLSAVKVLKSVLTKSRLLKNILTPNKKLKLSNFQS